LDGADERVARARQRYVEALRPALGDTADSLAAAFLAVPRERHLWPPPWRLMGKGMRVRGATEDPAELYQDVLVVLDAQRGINNGGPRLHAQMLAAVAPAPGARVVHVGAGLGYYTAILAELVGPRGRVSAIEVHDALAPAAAERLAGYPQVEVIHGSALEVDFAPADIIYVNAGVSHPHAHWLDRLLPGGRLLTPITSSAGLPEHMGEPRRRHGAGGALLVTRLDAERFAARFITQVGFVTCEGDEASALRARTWKAMQAGGHEAIRSLRRDPHAAESRCWFHADDFCLSTRDP
jgi:protein-L-isoaspartate(D-aspartate) O-methyltransferase